MHKLPARHIVKSYYRKLKKELGKVTSGFDTETIHQYRVAYKKLRAFIRMLNEQQTENKKLKISKKIKTYYHLCGLLRDLQLQQKYITLTNRKTAGYLRLQAVEIDKLQEQLKESISTDPVDKNKKSNNKKLPENIHPKTFKRYVREKWQQTADLLRVPDLSGQQLHAIRKNLKDLFYNLKAAGVQKDSKRLNYIPATLSWKNFNSLLHELGNFQDQSASIKLLTAAVIKKTSAKEQEQLFEIKAGWIKENALLKRLLIKKLRHYL